MHCGTATRDEKDSVMAFKLIGMFLEFRKTTTGERDDLTRVRRMDERIPRVKELSFHPSREGWRGLHQDHLQQGLQQRPRHLLNSRSRSYFAKGWMRERRS
jgi:hypothetical protein